MRKSTGTWRGNLMQVRLAAELYGGWARRASGDAEKLSVRTYLPGRVSLHDHVRPGRASRERDIVAKMRGNQRRPGTTVLPVRRTEDDLLSPGPAAQYARLSGFQTSSERGTEDIRDADGWKSRTSSVSERHAATNCLRFRQSRHGAVYPQLALDDHRHLKNDTG
ncbi:hypothetical protein OH76DRAFT_149489 [Lentinus brumalis]|uniref:Uncharacterized protein n=1 Tax=Lentinus brumalis TaxID=2498619 RepID=A0A371CNZ4_9APHY|nr:hypothetical protein OH76DRAFT_149489 [Polyporus brumalis]